MATLRADRRLYVNADRSEICEEDDPRSAFLLAAEGRNIGEGDVSKYGLQMKDGRVWWPEAKVVAAPEDKAVEAPAEPDDFDDEEDDEGDEVEEWPAHLRSDPAEYLEKYPDGKHAELARRLAGADE